MQTAVLTDIRKMEVREVPDPVLTGSGDVLLRVRSVGVCGSDVHYYATGRIGSQVVSYPFRVGHECACEVVQVGAAAKNLQPGDRVAVEPAMPCGRCDQCQAGRHHTCRTLRFLGCPGQAEGCLSELLVMPAGCCFPVRPATGLDAAAMVEPLSIAVYAVKMAGALTPDTRLMILGCGPIGLCALLAARAAGVRTVYATDRIDTRLALARACGAAWTGNPERDDVVQAVAAREPLGIDAVLECCGEPAAMDQAVEMLKPGGKLVLVGIPRVERVSFVIDLMRRKEIVLQNIRRQNHCVQAALDLIESGRADVAPLITHRFPLARVQEAFELVDGYRDGVIKALVTL